MQPFSLPRRERYFRISHSGDSMNEIAPSLLLLNPDCGIVVFQTCG
jgi:hypothetical protein